MAVLMLQFTLVLTGDLIKAVNELSHGYASPETVALLKSLERPLHPSGLTVRLFALNYDVEKCNSDHLLDMDGKSLTVDSISIAALTD